MLLLFCCYAEENSKHLAVLPLLQSSKPRDWAAESGLLAVFSLQIQREQRQRPGLPLCRRRW
jgi:hypothetical protein